MGQTLFEQLTKVCGRAKTDRSLLRTTKEGLLDLRISWFIRVKGRTPMGHGSRQNTGIDKEEDWLMDHLGIENCAPALSE